MIILDIEASGLGDESYPIEVAWADRFNPKHCDHFLIRPAEGWTYWDSYAEECIHGISRNTLDEEGVSVKEAVDRLVHALAGNVVYSDHVESDRPWMVRLFREAGQKELGFRFSHVQSLVSPDRLGRYYERFEQTTTEHRALDDVLKIIKTLDFVEPL